MIDFLLNSTYLSGYHTYIPCANQSIVVNKRNAIVDHDAGPFVEPSHGPIIGSCFV